MKVKKQKSRKNNASAKSLSAAYKVWEVIFHRYPHLDEALAYYEALVFGMKKFIGISKARLIFGANITDESEALWRKKGRLGIGVGPGPFNEHRNGDNARIEDSSACKLVFEFLKVEHPPTEALMMEGKRYDIDKGCPRSHLANVMKSARQSVLLTARTPEQSLKEYKKEQEEKELELFRWVLEIIDTVAHKMDEGLEQEPGEPAFLDFVAELVSKAKSDCFEDDITRERMLRDIKDTCASEKGADLLGLKHIYECLWRKSEKATFEEKQEEVGGEIAFILQLLYNDQARFQDCLRELRDEIRVHGKESIFFRIPVQRLGSEGTMWGAMVDTDSSHAHQVLRSMGAHITVVRNSTGNVSIQGNTERFDRTPRLKEIATASAPDLIGMLRFSELPKRFRSGVKFETLRKYGNYSKDDVWFLDAVGRMQVLNGSFSHEVTPARSTKPVIKSCITSAFSVPLHRAWKKRYGVKSLQLRQALAANEITDSFGDLELAFDEGLKKT